MQQRRRLDIARLLRVAAMCLMYWQISTCTTAQAADSVIFFESFDYLTLGPVNSTNTAQVNILGDVASSEPPAGWFVDNSNFGPTTCESFRGWRFWDFTAWADGFSNFRDQFEGTATIALYDSNQASACGSLGSEHTVLRTPDIQLSQQLSPDSLRLSFQTVFEAKDNMRIQVIAYFDGVRHIVLSTKILSPKLDYLSLRLSNPAGAKVLSVEFVTRDATGDWWWAIDNVAVSGFFEERPTVLLEEDFESLAGSLSLVNANYAHSISGELVTGTPPTGWAVDNTNSGSSNDCVSFDGWNFWSLSGWAALPASGGRTGFSDGSGVVALVDAEYYDNCGSTELMHTILVSPAINLAGIQEANSVQVEFDSSFLSNDTMVMVIELLIFYDGNFSGPAEVLMSTRNPGRGGDGHASEQMRFAVDNPEGASNMTVHWVVREANNARWWVIDNIVVKGGPAPFVPKLGDALFFESFDYVSLSTVSSTHASHLELTGDVVTAVPPQDWLVDNSNFVLGGCESFRGWRFWDYDAWATDIGGGGRADFFGYGTIAVFDSDQASKCPFTEAVHTILRTPEIQLSQRLVPNSLVLWFQSQFLPLGSMTIEVIAYLDGANTTLLSTMAPDPEHAGRVFFMINNTAGAKTLSVEFIARNATDDWYWAIDNVLLTGEFADLGGILFREDFESLAGSLAPVVANSSHDITGNAVTGTPSTGWTLDNSNYGSPSGCVSFDGWNFWDLLTWQSSLMDDREMFHRGRGVVALVDSDQYDNCGSTELMHTILTSPAIDMRFVEPNTTQVEFDSSYFRSGAMTIELLAYFDDDFSEPAATLLSTQNPGPYASGGWDERLRFPLENPAGASNLTLAWVVRQANDDWWWVIDNIAVKGQSVPRGLQECLAPSITCSTCECGGGIQRRLLERLRRSSS